MPPLAQTHQAPAIAATDRKVSEVARIWGVSPGTVLTMYRANLFRAKVLPSPTQTRIRIPQAEVERITRSLQPRLATECEVGD